MRGSVWVWVGKEVERLRDCVFFAASALARGLDGSAKIVHDLRVPTSGLHPIHWASVLGPAACGNLRTSPSVAV